MWLVFLILRRPSRAKLKHLVAELEQDNSTHMATIAELKSEVACSVGTSQTARGSERSLQHDASTVSAGAEALGTVSDLAHARSPSIGFASSLPGKTSVANARS
jgi:hypothetical protein